MDKNSDIAALTSYLLGDCGPNRCASIRIATRDLGLPESRVRKAFAQMRRDGTVKFSGANHAFPATFRYVADRKVN